MPKSLPPFAAFNTERPLMPWLAGMSILAVLACSMPEAARAQSAPSATWTVTIVLPSRVVAGQPATLAVLGADGKLAPDVTVELGDGQRLTTDRTGRASFTAPAAGAVLLAKASGVSAAALLDSVTQKNDRKIASISPAVSLREPFSICGADFQGNADANRVRISGEPALVMAASPECLSILPGSKAHPGPAQVAIQISGGQWTATTTLVSLEPEFPSPPMLPGKKGRIIVHVRGADQKLRILVTNQTPGVVRFSRGDEQELVSSGNSENSAEVEAQAIRSGDFSFDARLLPAPDESAARRYLEAAMLFAPPGLQHDVNELSKRLAHHPRNLDDIRRGLDRVLSVTVAGDFRTLLIATRFSL
jgi:hypothetical protein